MHLIPQKWIIFTSIMILIQYQQQLSLITDVHVIFHIPSRLLQFVTIDESIRCPSFSELGSICTSEVQSDYEAGEPVVQVRLTR